MSWGFKKTKFNSDHTLVVTLRSNNISFALLNEIDGKNNISYTAKYSLKSSNEISKNLELGIRKILSEGITSQSENKIAVKIKNVKVVFGADLYESYIKDLVIEKDKQFILTKEQFNKSIEKHAEIIKAEKEGKIIIERDVTNVMINGYSLQDPFDKKVTKLDVSFYASFVESDFLKNIEKIIKSNIPNAKICFKSSTLHKFNVLRNTFLNVPNYVSIDVTENYTNVFLVENSSLIYNKCFNFGYQNIIDEISKNCDMNLQIVESEIKMSSLGELKNTCKPEIESGIIEQKNKWASFLVSEIIDNEGLHIPSRIFLTTDKKVADIFTQALSDTEIKSKIFRNEKDLMIVSCSNKHFTKHISYKDDVESDIFNTINSINLND